MAFSSLSSLLRSGRRFDPNQPRVPAGNSDGGQWTSMDAFAGNASVNPESAAAPLIKIASAVSNLGRSPIGKNAAMPLEVRNGSASLRRIDYETRPVGANEAFFVLQAIQDREEAPNTKFFRGSVRITGILDRAVSIRGPATAITYDGDGTVTVRNGAVVSLTVEGRAPIFVGVTGDDSITINAKTGIVGVNRAR